MRIRPLNDTVIIEPDPKVKEIDTFLELPEKNSLEKRSHYGTVVSFGSKCKYKFHEGQRIILDRWSVYGNDTYFIWEGKKYRFIREQEINAVIE